VSAAAGLERGYRRLLAWYPREFGREHEEEMLAVLMAGAREGQRRPGLAEAADVLRSALRMRLRLARPGPGNGAWADSLAVFSVSAPIFLLAVDVLAVALPYRLPARSPIWQAFGPRHEIGGLSLLSVHIFAITVGCEVVLAALVLLGQRWLALLPLAASVGYWIVARRWIPWIPHPLQLLTTGVYLMVAVALLASPGPRHGRQAMHRGHWVVLLLIAGSVHAATLWYWATSPIVRIGGPQPPSTTVYLVLSIVLAVTAVTVALAMRVDRQFLLFAATACYPFAAQLAFSGSSSSGNLLGSPTPVHLAVLFVPPVLVLCAAVIAAIRSRVPPSPEQGEPGLA
jgi:uncharacterized membrane protein YidH (DUF202 family)